MSDNREYDPTNIMLSPQGYTFEDLAKLNAGVILDPLVSSQPIEEIDPFVSRGLASLSGHAVKEVIAAHTEPGTEFRTLLNRYKQIRCSVPPSALGEFGYPVAGEPAIKQKATPKEQRTAEEIYAELIFGSGEPDFSKIAPVMARNPKSPDNITFLEDLFKANGYDLDDPTQDAIRLEFSTAVAKAIGKFMFNPRRPMTENELSGMAVEWVGKMGDARFLRGVGLRLGAVKSFLKNVDPNNQNVEAMLTLAREIIASSENLTPILQENPAMGIALMSKIEGLLFERFKQYGSAEIAYIHEALGEDSRKIAFSPVFSSAYGAAEASTVQSMHLEKTDEEAA